MAYFCSDVLGADWYMSILSILGAVPMAIAAAFVVPLANKFSKQKLTLAGLALGVVGGVIAGLGGNNLVVVGIGIALKCLGSSPACYLILAMLADAIGLLGVGIVKLVYLYRTAKRFREYQPAALQKEVL